MNEQNELKRYFPHIGFHKANMQATMIGRPDGDYVLYTEAKEAIEAKDKEIVEARSVRDAIIKEVCAMFGMSVSECPVSDIKVRVEGLKREAAGRIAAESSISELREALNKEWISVSERLPKVWSNVLICHGYHKDQSVDEGFICEDGNFQLVRTDSYDEPIYIDAELVTHWMPIPEPPISSPAAGSLTEEMNGTPPEKESK